MVARRIKNANPKKELFCRSKHVFKKRQGLKKVKPLTHHQLYFRLPPPLNSTTRTVVLDLDRTLIHAFEAYPPNGYDFVVTVIDEVHTDYYVLKRPGVDELLHFLGERFEVVVFTAGTEEYASPILDELDRNRVISHRLYRDSCKEIMNGRYVKDLSELGRDMKKVVIVDDNPVAFMLQPENAIQIRPFVDDFADRQAWRLIEFFRNWFPLFEDCREAIRPLGWVP